jgi:hypothetical protein
MLSYQIEKNTEKHQDKQYLTKKNEQNAVVLLKREDGYWKVNLVKTIKESRNYIKIMDLEKE